MNRQSPIGQLVHKPAVNAKRTVSFLSVRRWRRDTRKADLELLKRGKADCNTATVLAIASEIAQLLAQLVHVKGSKHAWITSPPPGASYYNGAHFATEIAQETAALLGLPFHTAFKPRRPGGRRGSHPATFKTRGRLVLEPGLPDGLCILIDDLATSGTTLETCCAALATARRAVLPLAWLYEACKGD